MFKKWSAYLFLLPMAAILVLLLLVQASRSQESQEAYVRWQYQIVQYGPSDCSGGELQNSLNRAGAEGWEMVSFTQTAKGPNEIVLQMASLGYGKDVTPNLADSWQGIISPVEAPGCQAILKRPSH